MQSRASFDLSCRSPAAVQSGKLAAPVGNKHTNTLFLPSAFRPNMNFPKFSLEAKHQDSGIKDIAIGI